MKANQLKKKYRNRKGRNGGGKEGMRQTSKRMAENIWNPFSSSSFPFISATEINMHTSWQSYFLSIVALEKNKPNCLHVTQGTEKCQVLLFTSTVMFLWWSDCLEDDPCCWGGVICWTGGEPLKSSIIFMILVPKGPIVLMYFLPVRYISHLPTWVKHHSMNLQKLLDHQMSVVVVISHLLI